MRVIAYTFDGTDDQIEFAPGALASGSFGALTIAAFYKRSIVTSGNRNICAMRDTTLASTRLSQRFSSADVLQAVTSNAVSGPTLNSTSLWYLTAYTNQATPRFHVHDGTSWSHTNGSAALNATTGASSDRLFVGQSGASTPAAFFGGTLVCIGIKKADSSDATIETLSRTAWSAWTGFGFDWLIGFDSSLETAGVLQDQSAGGTGDEIAITGTTTASDPPGWSWATAPASTFVPQIAIL